MTKTRAEPFRPYHTRPSLNPKQFDPEQQTYVPDRSIGDAKISVISPRRFRLYGIRVYLGSDQTITSGAADADIAFDTVNFVSGFIRPTGTFNTVTIPYDGVYSTTLAVQWSTSSVNGRRSFITIAGGHAEFAEVQAYKDTAYTITSIRSLTQGQAVGGTAWQDSGADRSIQSSTTNLTVIYLGTI